MSHQLLRPDNVGCYLMFSLLAFSWSCCVSVVETDLVLSVPCLLLSQLPFVCGLCFVARCLLMVPLVLCLLWMLFSSMLFLVKLLMFSGCFGSCHNSGDKEPISINSFSGLSREWVGVKFVYVLPLSWAKRKHIRAARLQNEIAPEKCFNSTRKTV